MIRYSKTHAAYLKSGKCPAKGHKATVHVETALGKRKRYETALTKAAARLGVTTGRVAPPVGDLANPFLGLKAVCDICRASWEIVPKVGLGRLDLGNLFGDSSTTSDFGKPVSGTSTTPRTFRISHAPATVKRSRPNRRLPAGPVQILGVVEAGKAFEDIGDEPRFVDNRGSGVTMKRTLKVTRRWTQTYHMETEHARADGQSHVLGFSKLVTAELKRDLMQTLRSTYSRSGEVERTFEDTFELDVPPYTRMDVILHWQRIYQTGSLNVRLGNGKKVAIPFKVAVGLGVDPETYTAGETYSRNELKQMTVSELRDLADQSDIRLLSKMTKHEIVETIFRVLGD